jgi:hypothetical protein
VTRTVLAVAIALGWSGLMAAAASAATTITSGPEGNSVLTSATFSFASTDGGQFECSLDSGAFAPCSSPDTVGPLAVGAHTFAVRTASAPAADAARVEWTIVPPISTPIIALTGPVKKHLHPAQLRTVEGTAAAPSGVHRVQVALYRGRPDKSYFPPACHFVALDTGAPILQPCLLPPYVTARGTARWHYAVPAAVRRHLRHGSYHLVVRALNSYDNATRHEFALTVR